MGAAGARVYLDWNATAPPQPGVAEGVAAAWANAWGNPSSAHGEGRRARIALEEARARIASAVGASSSDVVLTSGGSEADALALRGLVDAGRVRTLVLWALEHPAVLETARWLAERGAAELRLVPATAHGTCAPEAIAEALQGAARPLVSVMLAQNEIGTVNDVAAIAAAARAAGALVHTDAVQALGKVPVDRAALAVDLLSVSAHKIGGPPGAGALVVGPGLDPLPFCLGGGQEHGRRQGTEGWPAVVGFGIAAAGLPARLAQAGTVRALRDRLEGAVRAALPGTLVAGARADRLPNTVAFLFEGVRGADVATAADALGLAVSAGSACHAGAAGRSPVARALGTPASHSAGLVRVSLGPSTTDGEIDAGFERLVRAVRNARG